MKQVKLPNGLILTEGDIVKCKCSSIFNKAKISNIKPIDKDGKIWFHFTETEKDEKPTDSEWNAWVDNNRKSQSGDMPTDIEIISKYHPEFNVFN
jgi:hypothetical protein